MRPLPAVSMHTGVGTGVGPGGGVGVDGGGVPPPPGGVAPRVGSGAGELPPGKQGAGSPHVYATGTLSHIA